MPRNQSAAPDDKKIRRAVTKSSARATPTRATAPSSGKGKRATQPKSAKGRVELASERLAALRAARRELRSLAAQLRNGEEIAAPAA